MSLKIGKPRVANNKMKWLIALFLVVLATAGFFRLHFNTDILAIFPQEQPSVQAMQQQRHQFENGGRLVILLQNEEPEELLKSADALANHLKDHHFTSKILYKTISEEDPKTLVELVSYLWANNSEERLRDLLKKTDNNQLSTVLEASQEEIAMSMDPAEITLLARDPLGLLQHPSLKNLPTTNPYLSDNAKNKLLIVYPNKTEDSSGKWFKAVQASISQWAKSHPSTQYGLTGSPAFAGEVAKNVKRDVIIAISISSLFSAIVFWLLVRNNRLIHLQVLLLFFIIVLTLGIGSLIIGSISLMSIGFASVLIGLAVDYGMIICTEARHAQGSPYKLQLAVSKSIIFAAISTAVVFATLTVSSLPGVIELGVFVSVGVLVSVIILLLFYVPIAAKLTKYSAKKTSKKSSTQPTKRSYRVITTALATLLFFTGLALTIYNGKPKVDFDIKAMTATESDAETTLKSIKKHFPSQFAQPQTNLLLNAATHSEAHETLAELDQFLLQHKEYSMVAGFHLKYLWPNPKQQTKNLELLNKLAERKQSILNTLESHGYSGDALRLNDAVLTHFAVYAKEKRIPLPSQAAVRDHIDSIYLGSNNKGSGLITLVSKDNKQAPQELLDLGFGISSWSIIEATIPDGLMNDLLLILKIVSTGVLIVLIIALRCLKDVLAGIVCLVIPLFAIIAIVHYSSLQWNFLNIFALPLIVGMGVDYVVHIIFSLRRNNKDENHVSKGVQRTLLCCGATSTVGFLSLATSSNQAFTSLGIVCGLGILLTMLFCLIVLPRLIAHRHLS